MVGRPCGQFHGARSVARLSNTPRMRLLSSARPIMMLDRHARIASMARTREGRVTSPDTETRVPPRRPIPDGGLRPRGERVLAAVQHAYELAARPSRRTWCLCCVGIGRNAETTPARVLPSAVRALFHVAKPEPVCEEGGHVPPHRLFLRRGEI